MTGQNGDVVSVRGNDNYGGFAIFSRMLCVEKHLCISFLVIAVKLRNLCTDNFTSRNRQGEALAFDSKIDCAASNFVSVGVLRPLFKKKLSVFLFPPLLRNFFHCLGHFCR